MLDDRKSFQSFLNSFGACTYLKYNPFRKFSLLSPSLTLTSTYKKSPKRCSFFSSLLSLAIRLAPGCFAKKLGMKFTSIFVVFAALTATALVSAGGPETNAQRLARGLPPLPPRRRDTSDAASKPKPSGSPSPCTSGTSAQCCDKLTQAKDPMASLLLGLYDIVVDVEESVALECSPLSAFDIRNKNCGGQCVCCQHNSFDGVIAVGCSILNL